MCDTMVSLTADGVLFAKNSDRDPNEAQFLDWVPSGEFSAGTSVRCTWIDIPQVRSTRATLLSRPWWIWGAEMGANDAGVVIGNEAVFTDVSRKRSLDDQPGLIGMDLLRLALERSASAEQAVQVIVDLLERYGQAGAHSHAHPNFVYDNSFLIADGSSAYVLETAGRSWASERVAEGSHRSISNALTIQPFASSHEDRLRTRVADARIRCANTSNAAATATGPIDLARALRSHGDSMAPRFSIINGHMKSPCMHTGGLVASSQCVSSWISDLRNGDSHWVTATAAPCLSMFKPVDLDSPVDLGTAPDDHFDPGNYWWRHERLHRLALRGFERSAALIASRRDELEREWFTDGITSAEAFEVSDEMEQDLADELSRTSSDDNRPAWLRRLWAKLDGQAGAPDWQTSLGTSAHHGPVQQLRTSGGNDGR